MGAAIEVAGPGAGAGTGAIANRDRLPEGALTPDGAVTGAIVPEDGPGAGAGAGTAASKSRPAETKNKVSPKH